MAPSRYDWKIVDWDVKPQHNQPTNIHSGINIVKFSDISLFYWRFGQLWMDNAPYVTNELPHDKTSQVTVRPAKTQISLGIRPVWSESLLCA